MKKTLIVTGICIVLLIIAYLQFNNHPVLKDPRGDLFAGSAACAKCHSSLYNSYLHTAHSVASIAATEKTAQGSFAKGFNVFNINDSQKVVMEKLDSGLFQTYYINGSVKKRYRFDIVFGGVKGETYLYWKGNELYQLPVSYFNKQRQWSTSPGYGYNLLDYSRSPRAIGKQCLECHASYIKDLPGESQKFTRNEEFDKSSLIYGIDCERCHGPGAQHAAFQASHPEVKTARFIASYRSLNRSQRMDMCAVCHSAKPGVMLRSAFGFVPGDTFAKFKMPELYHPVDTGHLDVHGNQLQLLQSSKCFIGSKMDCATCHDTHQNTRGNDALYTQKCFSCHNTPNHTYCKMTGQLSDAALKANCISCHMPALPTKIISVQVSGRLPSVQFFVHTHHIAIYPAEVKKVLAYINE
jgi:hypothetical protein